MYHGIMARKMNLSDFLRLRRGKLTRAQLAEAISVSESTISRWLDRDPSVRTRPTADALAKIEVYTRGQVTAASWDMPDAVEQAA